MNKQQTIHNQLSNMSNQFGHPIPIIPIVQPIKPVLYTNPTPAYPPDKRDVSTKIPLTKEHHKYLKRIIQKYNDIMETKVINHIVDIRDNNWYSPDDKRFLNALQIHYPL